MRFVADFHIHSHYSRACSRDLTPEHLEYWGKLKGLQLIGTGDAVHPGWLAELREKLEPADNGLYRLKAACRLPHTTPARLLARPLYFMPTTEISSIYKKGGEVRKVHSVCVLPTLEAAERLGRRLEKIGNIRSDGRPILGLDCKHLLELVLETAPEAYVIPAHIWTPWFSVLGSKSGFNSLEACFEDLTGEIFAVETGLSSDPIMNRACTFLDRVRLVSNSDAHSPQKLGREATVFDAELGYRAVYEALKYDRGLLGTIEFFPQEGKYHHDGHRKCGVSWDPLTTVQHQGRCPECGKDVTRGVLYRVAELADRADPAAAQGRQQFWSITPLPELLAEMLGVRTLSSRAVTEAYHRVLERLGSEFDLLLTTPLSEIERAGGERLAQGIGRLREGRIQAEAGYDGEFGRISVFGAAADGPTLFLHGADAASETRTGSMGFDIDAFRKALGTACISRDAGPSQTAGVTDEQAQAIQFGSGVAVVLAGPGAGKTRVLTERIRHLVHERGIPAAHILALTFSNRAADEMRRRLAALGRAGEAWVGTFHAFGLEVLKAHADCAGLVRPFRILDEDERVDVVTACTAGRPGRASPASLARALSAAKQGILGADDPEVSGALQVYGQRLRELNAVDLDDLVALPAQLLESQPALQRVWQARSPWILVDECQDLNAAQFRLLMVLAGASPNLFLIGDPDQAIYGFRGSDPRIIDRIRERFQGTVMIRLTRSWRCPDPVLRGAGQVLQTGGRLSGAPGRVKIHLQSCPSERDEARWIAERIEQLIGGTGSLSINQGMTDGETAGGIATFRDFAVLARTASMLEPIGEALAARGIPHRVIGAEPFYRREPLRGLLRRCAAAAVGRDAAAVPAAVAARIARRAPLPELLALLCADIESADRDRLASLAGAYASDYAGFFESLALREAPDEYLAHAEQVWLMTMHAAKGLEFEAVFIAGCEEGLMPFERFGTPTPEQLAEEERLCYVAMTRTKQLLFLSHAATRQWQGRRITAGRSRLLDRIESRLVVSEQRVSAPRDPYQQLAFFTEPAAS